MRSIFVVLVPPIFDPVTGIGHRRGEVPEIANAVKRDCPLSQALASVPEITLKAKLR